MTLLTLGVLAVLAFLFVAWPLLRRPGLPTGAEPEDAALLAKVEQEVAARRERGQEQASAGDPAGPSTGGTPGLAALLLGAAAVAMGAWATMAVPPALAQGLGTIEGRLSNGTPQGAPVGGATVLLASLLPSGEAVTVASATAAADGSFLFEGLNTSGDLRYQARAIYQDGGFRSPIVSFSPGSRRLAADIQAFDTTADPAAVRFASVVTIVERSGDRLVVTQPLSVLNATDRAYIGPATPEGEPRQSLVIPLPRGVQTVQYLEGIQPEEAELTPAGILFHVPLAPGAHAMLLRYEMPIAAKRYRFSWRAEFATDRFDIVLNGAPAEAPPGPLKDQGSISFQGREFQRLAAQGVAPGVVLEATLVGLPFFDAAQALRWAALGAGLALGALLAMLAVRQAHAPSAKGALAAERARLLEEVAALDEQFKGGGAEAAAYQRQRHRRMARLLSLTKALREE